MLGNNTMELNTATMVKIIQHYFDTVLFAAEQSPKVMDAKGTGNNTFVVAIQTKGEK